MIFAMKMLAIVRMDGGEIDIDQRNYPYAGHVLAGIVPGWGAYVLTGRANDLAKVKQLEQVYEIVTVNGQGRLYLDNGLDTLLPAAIRNRLNAWISDNTTWDEIPAGRTCRQAVIQFFRLFNIYFNLARLEVVNRG